MMLPSRFDPSRRVDRAYGSRSARGARSHRCLCVIAGSIFLVVGSTEAADAPSKLPRALAAGKVELRDPDGKELFSWKPHGSDEIKFRDGAGQELASFTLSDGRLKAKSPTGQTLFELKRKDEKIMVKDASDREVLKFKLKGQDIELETPDGRRLYKIQKRDFGFALENASAQTLFRAKTKDGKVVLRDPQDRTVLESKDLKDPLGLVFFRMKELTPVQQGACLVLFARMHE